jgi:hypothetical protein
MKQEFSGTLDKIRNVSAIDMAKAVNSIDFPLPAGGFVYIFYFADTPFYVGQADCFQTRMTDYHRKAFASSTDFNVGEAAAYFSSKDYPVKVGYWASEDRYSEETETIADLVGQGYELLNEKLYYDYRGPKETRQGRIQQQRNRVQEFCDSLIAAHSQRATTAGN